MATGSIFETLREAQFTQGLKNEHLEKLADIAFEVHFARDDTVYTEGDFGDVLYLVQEGLIAVETYVPGKGRVSILTVGPGQLLGWSAFFPNKRKTASGRALTSTYAIAISAPQLREACQADCEFGYEIALRIAELIADRLKATRLQLMDIFAPAESPV